MEKGRLAFALAQWRFGGVPVTKSLTPEEAATIKPVRGTEPAKEDRLPNKLRWNTPFYRSEGTAKPEFRMNGYVERVGV